MCSSVQVFLQCCITFENLGQNSQLEMSNKLDCHRQSNIGHWAGNLDSRAIANFFISIFKYLHFISLSAVRAIFLANRALRSTRS